MMLDLNGTQTSPSVVKEAAPVITTTTTVTPESSESRTHLLSGDEQWGWKELRDYVVSSIEQKFGPFPRDYKKEYGIFSSYLTRYGNDAPKIARAAFESYNGMWSSAPISINRFCKASDPFFSDVILNKINS